MDNRAFIEDMGCFFLVRCQYMGERGNPYYAEFCFPKKYATMPTMIEYMPQAILTDMLRDMQ